MPRSDKSLGRRRRSFSALSDVLQHAGDVIWPFLGRTPANLALTNQHVRKLCLQHVQQLTLSAVHSMSEQRFAAFTSQLSSCRTVLCTVNCSSHDVIVHLTSILPALARLPRLSALSLKAAASTAVSSLDSWAAALEPLSLQFPRLQQLNICLAAFTPDSPDSSELKIWKVLGKATQLCSLSVGLAAAVPSINLGHIVHLQPLKGLQNLAIAGRMVPDTDYTVCSGLTALTGLSLPLAGAGSLCSAVGLTSISLCTKLSSLLLNADDQEEGARPRLFEEDCQAVAQLIQLTELRLVSTSSENGRDLAAALEALTGLEALTVELSAAELTALSALTRLTELFLAVNDRIDPAKIATPVVPSGMCPSVRTLAVTGMQGRFPFQAFSNTVDFTQWSSKGADYLLTVAHRFPLLQRYHLGGEFTVAETDSMSLDPYVPTGHRDTAINSLSSLQHLTELTFSVGGHADICRLSRLSQLRKLWILAPKVSHCSFEGFLSLAEATHLRHVVLEVAGLVMSRKRATRLIVKLHFLQQLELYVRNPTELANVVSKVPAGQKPLEVFVRSFE